MSPQDYIASAQASLSAALWKLSDEAKAPGVPPKPKSAGYLLSPRSLERLEGVHPDLLAVVQYAIGESAVDFGIPATGGVRTPARQRQLLAAGKSKTMRSRHLSGHAVDIFAYVGGKASWHVAHILEVHRAFTVAGEALGVPLRWGGDWDGDGQPRERGEDDLVHHELPRGVYGRNAHSQSSLAADYLAELGVV